MSSVIDWIDIGGSGSGLEVKLQNTIKIFIGGAIEVTIIVEANSDEDIGERLINLLYRSEWSEGAVIIESNLSIDIQKPVEIQSTVQNVIIDKDTFVET